MKLYKFEPYDIVLPREDQRHSGSDYDDSYDSYDNDGYDDNTIDSAFEGIPEAYWNID